MIYCVEDDNSIRELMIYTLTASGYEAIGFPDGKTFLEAVGKNTPRLVMLDIMLPGMDGLEILKKLRSNPITADIPVIMATAKGTEYDKVIGLDMGADDYLTKPFGMMEMVSHIKAVLRRCQTPKQVCSLALGRLQLDLKKHTVTCDGKKVELTLKEFALLRLFMENPGQVFSRDRLLSSVWGLDFVGETRTVDVHIGTLRTKLGECGNYIETVRGIGYKAEEKI